jgi:hypothetical protein
MGLWKYERDFANSEQTFRQTFLMTLIIFGFCNKKHFKIMAIWDVTPCS